MKYIFHPKILLVVVIFNINFYPVFCGLSDKTSQPCETNAEDVEMQNDLKSILSEFQILQNRLQLVIGKISKQNSCDYGNDVDSNVVQTSEQIPQNTTHYVFTPSLMGSNSSVNRTFPGITQKYQPTLESIELNYALVDPNIFLNSIQFAKNITSIRLHQIELTEPFNSNREVTLNKLENYFIQPKNDYNNVSEKHLFPFKKEYKWDTDIEYKTKDFAHKLFINRTKGVIFMKEINFANKILSNLSPHFVLKHLYMFLTGEENKILIENIPSTIEVLAVGSVSFQGGNLGNVIKNSFRLKHIQISGGRLKQEILEISDFSQNSLKSLMTFNTLLTNYSFGNISFPNVNVVKTEREESLDETVAANLHKIFPFLKAAIFNNIFSERQKLIIESFLKIESLQFLFLTPHDFPYDDAIINSTALNINKAFEECKEKGSELELSWCKFEKKLDSEDGVEKWNVIIINYNELMKHEMDLFPYFF